jgi:hypothetical protein
MASFCLCAARDSFCIFHLGDKKCELMQQAITCIKACLGKLQQSERAAAAFCIPGLWLLYNESCWMRESGVEKSKRIMMLRSFMFCYHSFAPTPTRILSSEMYTLHQESMFASALSKCILYHRNSTERKKLQLASVPMPMLSKVCFPESKC